MAKNQVFWLTSFLIRIVGERESERERIEREKCMHLHLAVVVLEFLNFAALGPEKYYKENNEKDAGQLLDLTELSSHKTK